MCRIGSIGTLVSVLLGLSGCASHGTGVPSAGDKNDEALLCLDAHDTQVEALKTRVLDWDMRQFLESLLAMPCNSNFYNEIMEKTKLEAELRYSEAGDDAPEFWVLEDEVMEDMLRGPIADRFFRPSLYVNEVVTAECIATARAAAMPESMAEGPVNDAIRQVHGAAELVCAEMAGLDMSSASPFVDALGCGNPVAAINTVHCGIAVEEMLLETMETYLLEHNPDTNTGGLTPELHESTELVGSGAVAEYVEAADEMCGAMLDHNQREWTQSREDLHQSCLELVKGMFHEMPTQMAEGTLVSNDVWHWLGVHPQGNAQAE